jgi:flagellar basal body-associated protein FliL
MDSQKRKKIIIIALIVIIVIVVLIFAFRLTDYGKDPDNKDSDQLPQFKAPSANLQYKDVPPIVSNDELAAAQVAMNFAERFGTYSSDLPGENIKQLLGQCTNKLVTYLNKMEIEYQAKEFKGMTTKSISNKITEMTNNQAEIVVQTQRQESKTVNGNLVSSLLYQDIKVNLIKSDKQWLVDAAYWQ